MQIKQYTVNIISGIRGRTIHFFGNEAVCVFKYFVTATDPQRYFSITILLTNFMCFLVICCSYIVIGKEANSTSSSIKAKRQKRNIQIKISLIILTDFLCWIPFIVVCFLHYSERIDARPWYTNFSIIILPINSLVNPLLYNSTIKDFTLNLYKRVSSVVQLKIGAVPPLMFIRRRPNRQLQILAEKVENAEKEAVIELMQQT